MGVLSAIALAVTAVSTVSSIKQGKKAVKGQKAANAATRKANQLRNKQAKRAFLRNFRQTQAVAISSAIASGVGLDSSLVQGTLSSEKTQAKTALREFKAFDELGATFTAATNRAASASFKSAAFGQVAGFASNFITFGGSDPSTTTGTGTPPTFPGGGPPI